MAIYGKPTEPSTSTLEALKRTNVGGALVPTPTVAGATPWAPDLSANTNFVLNLTENYVISVPDNLDAIQVGEVVAITIKNNSGSPWTVTFTGDAGGWLDPRTAGLAVVTVPDGESRRYAFRAVEIWNGVDAFVVGGLQQIEPVEELGDTVTFELRVGSPVAGDTAEAWARPGFNGKVVSVNVIVGGKPTGDTCTGLVGINGGADIVESFDLTTTPEFTGAESPLTVVANAFNSGDILRALVIAGASSTGGKDITFLVTAARQ